MRTLRLAVHELRGISTTLHGHAGRLPADHPQAPGLVSLCAQLTDMTDELAAQAQPADACVLREEVVSAVDLLDEAIVAVSASLGPGRRHWRIGVDQRTALWADRRALRHVFGRVLTDAVRNTGHGDWIDIAVRPHAEGLAVVIADEGVGTANPDPAQIARSPDSRGIGLRLALARNLMAAHGGRLEIEAMAQVGTRVTLVFPAERLLAAEMVMTA